MSKRNITLPTWRNLAAAALIEARATLVTEPYADGMRLTATYNRAAMSDIINPYRVRRNAAIRPAMVAAGDYLAHGCTRF